jgi:hypothetical protein
VIGLLRFVGLLNAAVWLGAAVFFLLGAGPAASSDEMQNLLGQKNYPYFSTAIAQIIASRYFHLYLVCASLALLHLLGEWLYFGKYPQRFSLGLLLGLCLIGLAQDYWLQPRLKVLHKTLYQTQALRPEQREPASHAFHVSGMVAGGLDWLALGGLLVYLWRLANPPDVPRFLSATKFRS